MREREVEEQEQTGSEEKQNNPPTPLRQDGKESWGK